MITQSRHSRLYAAGLALPARERFPRLGVEGGLAGTYAARGKPAGIGEDPKFPWGFYGKFWGMAGKLH